MWYLPGQVRWLSYAVTLFSIEPWDIVWSDLHTFVYTQQIVATYIWLLPRPAMYGRYQVYPLTHSSPSPTEVCPCLNEAAADYGGNAHIKKLKKYHLQPQQVCNMYVWCTRILAADCAIIPYHLKCTMRSSEVPLISQCFMVSFNFSQLCENTCKPCNIKGISSYLELSLCRLTICHCPKTAYDCWWQWWIYAVTMWIFVESNTDQYGNLHTYHNFIHRIHGHNPGCSSKHDIC